MRLTTKGRFAVTAMIDLGLRHASGVGVWTDRVRNQEARDVVILIRPERHQRTADNGDERNDREDPGERPEARMRAVLGPSCHQANTGHGSGNCAAEMAGIIDTGCER